MADSPNKDDKIEAGPNGAIVYSFKTGRTEDLWYWEKKPVRLDATRYLFSTGEHYDHPTLGRMYEVYMYRRNGSSQMYPTESDARVGVFDGGLFLWSKINREIKYLLASETMVVKANANTGKAPDIQSPIAQEKTEKDKLEEELQKLVYDKNPAQVRHSALTKNSEGKWYLVFPNGYTVDYTTFMNLTPIARQNAATVDMKTGLAPGQKEPKSGDEKTAFPTWAYGIIAVLVVSVIGLFVLSAKPKSKR